MLLAFRGRRMDSLTLCICFENKKPRQVGAFTLYLFCTTKYKDYERKGFNNLLRADNGAKSCDPTFFIRGFLQRLNRKEGGDIGIDFSTEAILSDNCIAHLIRGCKSRLGSERFIELMI